MRYLYSFLLYLAMPVVLLRLFIRSRRLPAYRSRLLERFGFYPVSFSQSLWVHAVSMGETIAAVPLIKALHAQYPALPIVITTMTPTGAAQAQAALGDIATHLYIPYDLPGATQRLLHAINPVISVTMETELWPNMFAACKQKNIPICLMNARLSAKSAAAYGRIARLAREMLQTVTVIAAHGTEDAERFIALGAPAERVVVTGNIKFDMTVSEEILEKANALRANIGNNRFVWIAASTHEGEEEIILAAHKQICQRYTHALLILVPRHPDRFDVIATLAAQSFSIERRSQTQICHAETSVYIGDTMGELLVMYAAADVAFVGGSLIPRGGHNILEPSVLSKPVLSGEHLFNFKEISATFIAANALTIVHNASELAEQVLKLAENSVERAKQGARAQQVIEANRGALVKQLNVIKQVYDQRIS